MILNREYIFIFAVVVVGSGFIYEVVAEEGFGDALLGDASNENINGFMTWQRSAEIVDTEAAYLIKEVCKIYLSRAKSKCRLLCSKMLKNRGAGGIKYKLKKL